MRAALVIALLAALSPAGARAAPAADDDDFEEDRPRPSLALGAADRARAVVALDVGWLRSGVRADLGVGGGFDLFVRADTMLLYEGFSGQSAINLGLRWSPLRDDALRVSVEASAGQVIIPIDPGTATLTTFRGDLHAGTALLPYVLVYGRFGLRVMRPVAGDRSDFTRELETGLGVEHAWRRYVFGAEAFVLSRPDHTGFGQWRLRAGIAL